VTKARSRIGVMAPALLLALVAIGLGGCRSGSSDKSTGTGAGNAASLRVDTSPRIPDDEGVLSAVTVDRVTIDGKRHYPVSDGLKSFSTFDRRLQPLLGFEGRYVQVGLRKGQVVWLGGIAPVVPGGFVYYSGTVRKVDAERRAYFADGTVLRLADGVEAPPKGRMVQARIDAAAHRVAAFLG
jgi:hypothetical protein